MSVAVKPPAGLGSAGKALWKAITTDVVENGHGWSLEAKDLAMLEQAARALDEAAALDAQVAAQGRMIEGSQGQVRLNSAIGEARLQRQVAVMTLAKVQTRAPALTGALNGRQRERLASRELGRRIDAEHERPSDELRAQLERKANRRERLSVVPNKRKAG